MTTITRQTNTPRGQSPAPSPARNAFGSRYRWAREALRRTFTPSSARSHVRDVLTVVGGYVVAVGLSAVLLALWALVVALLAGILTVGSLDL